MPLRSDALTSWVSSHGLNSRGQLHALPRAGTARTVAIFLLLLALVVPQVLLAQTLPVISGGSSQRPDRLPKLFDAYEQVNPGVKIEIETGDQTADLQRDYLTRVLSAWDSSLDVFMIDITNSLIYQSKGWIEPLKKYLGAPSAVLSDHLPVYRTTNVINGELYALPAFAEAMFVYYRKDLLAKYGMREPRTWDALAAAGKKIQAAEKNQPALQGLSVRGAPIEGTVCTFLLPLWSKGGNVADHAGRFSLDPTLAKNALNVWLKLIDQGVISKNVANVKTIDTVNDFKAGNVIFAVNWGFAWDQFQTDADSKVKGLVDVMPVARVDEASRSATCIGGWQGATSAFSTRKEAAAKLIRTLSTPNVARFLAVEGSLLPVFSATYTEPDYLAKVPWAAGAGVIATFARSRPVSPHYGEVSDTLRTQTSAALARKSTPDEADAAMNEKLKALFK